MKVMKTIYVDEQDAPQIDAVLLSFQYYRTDVPSFDFDQDWEKVPEDDKDPE